MKKFTIFTLFFALIAVVTMTGCQKNAYQATRTAGDYTVNMQINHNPPIAAENLLTLDIKDKSGNKVTDANVVVRFSMPPMPGMPPMDHQVDAVLSGQAYKATVDLHMAGPWNIEAGIQRGNTKQIARFSVDAR
ncbi:MAG: hypothetical protein ACD_20C00124G0004 [uncultured bacterium]|nr:MAG: hypothetical protein ACD_20C00124G0004 [uncultured bacterium]